MMMMMMVVIIRIMGDRMMILGSIDANEDDLPYLTYLRLR